MSFTECESYRRTLRFANAPLVEPFFPLGVGFALVFVFGKSFAFCAVFLDAPSLPVVVLLAREIATGVAFAEG